MTEFHGKVYALIDGKNRCVYVGKTELSLWKRLKEHMRSKKFRGRSDIHIKEVVVSNDYYKPLPYIEPLAIGYISHFCNLENSYANKERVDETNTEIKSLVHRDIVEFLDSNNIVIEKNIEEFKAHAKKYRKEREVRATERRLKMEFAKNVGMLTRRLLNKLINWKNGLCN